ncbi:MAG: hypothetical protein HYZ50_09605 [Deltaproteobacteria bacterium]|nr:hypothetical protein [Deltaproteobacteria bacterium]
MDGVQVESASPAQYTARPARVEKRPLSWTVTEILTPEQFFQRATDSARIWTGERRLLAAVLHNAVETIFRYRHDYSPHGRRLFKEAHDWFWSAQAWGLYSFESICSHLQLEASYIRRGLKRWYDPATVSFTPVRKAYRPPRHLNAHLTMVGGGKMGSP